MAREEINEQQLEDVVGGNFNWWKTSTGVRKCKVTGLGTFICTVDAKDTFAWLKAAHQGEGWTEQDYVNALLASGDFTRA